MCWREAIAGGLEDQGSSPRSVPCSPGERKKAKGTSCFSETSMLKTPCHCQPTSHPSASFCTLLSQRVASESWGTLINVFYKDLTNTPHLVLGASGLPLPSQPTPASSARVQSSVHTGPHPDICPRCSCIKPTSQPHQNSQ